MGKELIQFIFSISIDPWIGFAIKSHRKNSALPYATFMAPVYERLKQVMRLLRFQAAGPFARIALLAGILAVFFPLGARASEVALASDVKNQTQDGFGVLQRADGWVCDYGEPLWPTHSRDHIQTSYATAGLDDDVRYYFVVRAYADQNQTGNSDEATFKAPAPSPVTIVNRNHPPAAEAGDNLNANTGDRLVLDGTGSSDPDGDRLTYVWTQKSGPTAELSGADNARCSFTVPGPTADPSAMVFELTVTDSQGESSGDTCVVLIHSGEQAFNNDENTAYGNDNPDDNHPPVQPTLMGIADGENSVSLTPLLSASEFDDPDSEDDHTQTEWRIFLTDGDQQIVFARTCDLGHLSAIRIPHLILLPSTGYLAQVRYYDGHGTPSPWSQPVVFTTTTDGNDLDRNGIPDSQEINTATDMNTDAISDLEQESVIKCLATYNAQHMISAGVEANDPTVRIVAAVSIDPATLSSFDELAPKCGCETPYGLLAYRIKVDVPGEIITVKVNLSDPLDPLKTRWVRYDAVDGILNCDVSTDMEDDGRQVYRYLVDGGEEDADGVANGVIVELSGPRQADAVDEADDASLTTSDNGQATPPDNSSGCFIQALF